MAAAVRPTLEVEVSLKRTTLGWTDNMWRDLFHQSASSTTHAAAPVLVLPRPFRGACRRGWGRGSFHARADLRRLFFQSEQPRAATMLVCKTSSPWDHPGAYGGIQVQDRAGVWTDDSAASMTLCSQSSPHSDRTAFVSQWILSGC